VLKCAQRLQETYVEDEPLFYPTRGVLVAALQCRETFSLLTLGFLLGILTLPALALMLPLTLPTSVISPCLNPSVGERATDSDGRGTESNFVRGQGHSRTRYL
jgi:hypothetical protein